MEGREREIKGWRGEGERDKGIAEGAEGGMVWIDGYMGGWMN